MSREQTKAAHYIQQLDEARCNGNWDIVPELARKVRKHAPQRTCLVTTAESEFAVIQESHSGAQTGGSANARPSTSSSKSLSSISKQIPLLLEAIEKEHYNKEDVYQAKVCLGWIYWELGDSDLAVSSLPSGIEEEFSQLDGTNTDSTEWTKVCAMKASYIKGSSQQRSGAVMEALETFGSALPIIASNPPGPKQGKELRSWSELYLTNFCMISSHIFKSSITSIIETDALSAFRTWGKFWEAQSHAPLGGRCIQAEVTRRHVWREYYFTLSDVLQDDLPFPTTSLTTAYAEVSTRLQQRAELKKVETRYESLLLSEVQFPRAEEASEEVEVFINVVMQNWRILCGGNWKEHDLGEGGAEAVSRGVLDILYRAATKTFHSTSILRHLFTVHLTIAEFELAFKAFDTYMELVKKGKARVEKTGQAEHSLDDDETVLRTASEAIKALCRYGSRQEAEKAKDLGHYFEAWLDKHYPTKVQPESGHLSIEAPDAAVYTVPQVFALAWRCIGIAHAQWARYTYDAASRSELQLHALKCFRKSLLPQYESSKNAETLFPLGILLAERREIAPAIEVVKSGLLLTPSHHAPSTSYTIPFARERSLIPLWHLMSLLLSARHEFLTAARSCEGAFEQFQSPKNLFGESDPNAIYRSAHLNEKLAYQNHGVVEDMDDFEKENVLQVKMTQLALIEILEGPDVAVNASDELLSLYTRLFGDPQAEFTVPSTASAPPPQSSAGTIKSIKGSIFGRHGRSVRKPNINPISSDEKITALTRPQTTASVKAPTIHITSENGIAGKQRPSTRDGSSQHHEKLQKRPGSLSNKRNGGASRNRSPSVGRFRSNSKADHPIQNVKGEYQISQPQIESQEQDQWMNDGEVSDLSYPGTSTNNSMSLADSLKVGSIQLTARPKSQMPQRDRGLATQNSSQARNNRIPRLPLDSFLVTPVTHFPKDQQKRHKVAVLIKVWLLISRFYRRACMYDDAKGAIEEAQTLAKFIEADFHKDAGNLSVQETGWERVKSAAELKSDIDSERGYIALAEGTPYVALAHFESALCNDSNHPAAIVGLSNILLDIYAEELLPPPSIPNLVLPGPINTASSSALNTAAITTPLSKQPLPPKHSSSLPAVRNGPLGLPIANTFWDVSKDSQDPASTPSSLSSGLQPNYKESSTALLDRLAARDRAYGLLTTLTKLGTGWNYSEAWFTLARAYEEGGQPDKAREVLWWCVELEEGKAIRDWNVVGCGGYVL